MTVGTDVFQELEKRVMALLSGTGSQSDDLFSLVKKLIGGDHGEDDYMPVQLDDQGFVSRLSMSIASAVVDEMERRQKEKLAKRWDHYLARYFLDYWRAFFNVKDIDLEVVHLAFKDHAVVCKDDEWLAYAFTHLKSIAAVHGWADRHWWTCGEDYAVINDALAAKR